MGQDSRTILRARMPARLYRITFKTTAPEVLEQPVEADTHEEADGYLVLFRSDGTLVPHRRDSD
jgi:hypothetical protein